MCSANALTEITPKTAEVLVHFADGKPAVVLNSYGKGHSVLFNFNMLLRYRGEDGLALLGNALGWSLAKAGDDPGAAKLADLNMAWTQWRRDQVTEVVEMVRGVMNAKKPGLLLGAATTPRRFHVNHVFQEWKTWIERDYIDVVYPMDYFGEDIDLKDALEWQLEGVPASKIVPLLAVYRRDGKKTVPVTAETMSRQLDILKAYQVQGTGLFSNMRYSPELESMLTERWAE